MMRQILIECPQCGAKHLDWFQNGCRVCGSRLPKPIDAIMKSREHEATARGLIREAAEELACMAADGLSKSDKGDWEVLFEKMAEAITHKVIAGIKKAKLEEYVDILNA